MDVIALIVTICLNLYGCSESNEFVSKFEKKELPVYLNAEDYSVYKLFDNKSIIPCDDLKILQENCDKCRVYKYGYVFESNETFSLLLYSEDVSEDTVYYKLATLNSNNQLISSINVLEYCGDGPYLNGRILSNFSVYTVKRELLPKSEGGREIIKVKEIEKEYLIDKNGVIKQVSITQPQVKYYKMDNQGKFIPVAK